MKNPIKDEKPTKESKLIARGGSWNYHEEGACLSDRFSYYRPDYKFKLLGFRIVRNKK
jgi:formylglycine-generating enzyme required for sulfatase activity